MKAKLVSTLGMLWDAICRGLSTLWHLGEMAVDAAIKEKARSDAQGQANLAAMQRYNCLNIEREGNYLVVAEVLLDCLQDYAARWGLESPRSTTALLAQEGEGVFFDVRYGYCYRYIIPRSFSGLTMQPKMSINYSKNTAEDIQKCFNRQFPKYSREHGFGNMVAVHVCDARDGAVAVTLAQRNSQC